MKTSLAWLYRLEDAYRQRTGLSTWSMSDWHNDPGDLVLPVSMLSQLQFDATQLSRYRFLDSMYDTKERIASFYKLMLRSDVTPNRLAITHSSTTAIHLVFRSLAESGIVRILVVTPAYFSLFEVLRLYGGNTVFFHTDVTKCLIPQDVQDLATFARSQMVQAIFITNPIFAAGTALDARYIRALCSFAESSGIWLILDETLGGLYWSGGPDMPYATQPMTDMIDHPKGIYVWSVSKSLFLNGLKHALVIGPENIVSAIEKSADIVVGSLSQPQLALIEQIYCAGNMDELGGCARANISRFSMTYDLCATAIAGTNLELTPVDIGFHVVAFVRKPIAEPALVAEKIAARLIERIGMSTMPLAHFGFPPFSPVGFRVNLSKDARKLCRALAELAKIVDDYSHLAN